MSNGLGIYYAMFNLFFFQKTILHQFNYAPNENSKTSELSKKFRVTHV